MEIDHLAILRRVLADDAQAAVALQAALAPLREYDRRHSGDLVRTLRVYLQEGGNLSRAAGLLYLHRNSLYYRPSHIQALTGLSLDDEAQRLWLHLATLLVGSAS